MALLRASENEEDSIGFAVALKTFGTWAAIFFSDEFGPELLSPNPIPVAAARADAGVWLGDAAGIVECKVSLFVITAENIGH